MNANSPVRIVARRDNAANADFIPPVIMRRRFWNMLGYWCPGQFLVDASHARAMQKSILREPMVSEAAFFYPVKDLRSEDLSRFVVDGAKLLALEPDSHAPFIVAFTDAGRPPFRCMDDYIVDNKKYKRWKKAHPNFLGFWTGVEWDNEYIGPLRNIGAAIEAYRKQGLPEKVIRRAQEVLKKAVAGRDCAVDGLHECYKALRRYYFNDPGKMTFLRAGWCLDHYALEWGAGMAIMETTGTGLYRHQVSMFFARGAARQYGKPWAWYIATFYNGYDEKGERSGNNCPCYLNEKYKYAADEDCHFGPGYGMSASLNRRDMYLSYLSGASLAHHESWPFAHCQLNDRKPGEYELSPHGAAMKEWHAFTRRHPDRGVSYAPVALLLPFNQGMPHWGGSSWSFFPVERPDTMIDAFLYTLVPSSQDLPGGKEGCLANSEYGDIYDVLLPNPPGGPVPLPVLMNYTVAILLGKFEIDNLLARRLMQYVRNGGTLIVNSRQMNENLPAAFIGAKRTGQTCGVEGEVNVTGGHESAALGEPYDYERIVLQGAEPLWIDGRGGVLASVNHYGRGRVVLITADYMAPRDGLNLKDLIKGRELPLIKLLMRQIVKEVLPVEVQGDVEYGMNKVSDGWWVYLINNKGVTKFTRTPDKLDVSATSRVRIRMRDLEVKGVRALREDQNIAWDRSGNSLTIAVGPGDIQIVKITTGSRHNVEAW